MCDIYQNSVHLIEMSMRRDNIGIMKHSSPNGFDSCNNLNNLNAKTMNKDIDRISGIYELFWNGVTHIMFLQLRKIHQTNRVITIENMFTSFIVELLGSVIGLSSQNKFFANSQTCNNNNNNINKNNHNDNNNTRTLHVKMHENMLINHDLCLKWLIDETFLPKFYLTKEATLKANEYIWYKIHIQKTAVPNYQGYCLTHASLRLNLGRQDLMVSTTCYSFATTSRKKRVEDVK